MNCQVTNQAPCDEAISRTFGEAVTVRLADNKADAADQKESSEETG
jgi:hypothetical protein